MSLRDNIHETVKEVAQENYDLISENELAAYTEVIIQQIDRHNAGKGERLQLDEVEVGKIPNPAYIIVSPEMPQANKQALLAKMNDMDIRGMLLPEGLVEINSKEEMQEMIDKYAKE